MLPLMEETGKKTIHGASALALGLYVAAFFLVFHTLFLDLTRADGDTGWHLAAGRLILEQHNIPIQDPWSFTAEDTVWLNLSWAFDVFLAAGERLMGQGLFLLPQIAGAALLTLVVVCALRLGASPPATLLAVLPLMLYLPQSLTLRPQLITLLSAVAAYACLRFGRSWRWPVFFLPTLTLIWVNTHGGVLLLFPILGAFAAEAILMAQWRRLGWLTFACAICLLMLYANPLGGNLFEAMNRTMAGASRGFIDEWQPVAWGEDAVPTLWLTISALSGALLLHKLLTPYSNTIPRLGHGIAQLLGGGAPEAWISAKHPRPHLADGLLLILFFLLATTALRHVTLWMLLSLPLVARGLTQLRALASAPGLERDLTSPRALRGAWAAMLLAALLAAFAPVSWKRQAAPAWPEEEAGWIVANLPGALVFNHYNYGGLLIERSMGTAKVFVDGRAETAYPGNVLLDYRRFHFMEEGWQDLPKRYGANVILFPLNAPQTEWFRKQPGWREAHTGNVAAVLVREGDER
ncbi:MAG: hypothetical protein J0L97_10340 [Alphaproteobacteria bacterium]|nr:hypothetical protein [Alphaproteobacteria bacterium]